MVAGSMYWKSDRQKRKEFDVVVAERKAKEKNELWIKELEARDEEDKEIRAEKERRMRGIRAPEGAKRAEGADAVEEGEQRSTLESVKEMVKGKK